MSRLNILYNWYTLKPISYVRALGYRLDRLDSYRLTFVILLTLNSFTRFIRADLMRMFGGGSKTYNNVLNQLIAHGYAKEIISKRKTNLQALTDYKAYKITPEGKKAIKRFEDEMQIILDKLRPR